MKYSYNDVLKYVIENIKDMEREIDLALISMDEWRCPLSQAKCGEEIEDAIITAISDYEIDNDDRFEEDEVLNDILSNKDIEDILFDALNYKDKQLSESVRPMKRVNENRMTRKGIIWKDEEWDDENNIHYIFQLSKMVMFEVDYYRLGGNKMPHFATSAQVFCRNKKDISRGGQCQADVLKDFPVAYEFWKKWDNKHLYRLDYETYEELLDDIEVLKDEYNWDYTKSGNGFPFWREVELSKQKPKRRMVRDTVRNGF